MSSTDHQSGVIPADQRDIKAEDAKIAEINAEGSKIFDDFVARQKKDKQFAQLDPQSKYEYYLKGFPDFARSNPIILRYITLGMFSSKAVFCYLKRCYERQIMTDEDYCERNADFVRFLYHFNTKIRGAELEKIWHDTKRLLMEELEEIAKEREKIKAERASRSSNSDDVRREAFKAVINKAIIDAKAKVAAARAATKPAELEAFECNSGKKIEESTCAREDVNDID